MYPLVHREMTVEYAQYDNVTSRERNYVQVGRLDPHHETEDEPEGGMA